MKRPWLMPLVPLYAAGAALRRIGQETRLLTRPVISVGNLSTGGTGKTPFVIALAQLLRREGIEVDVLSRGYGRATGKAALVNMAGSAEEFGDEPVLIAREAQVPVYVGTRRWEAGRLAEAASSETLAHLLDDGFQHRQLARNADIVLVNSDDLRDSLLPAGNLREGIRALRRAAILAIPTGDEAALARVREMGLPQPVWRFTRKMIAPQLQGPVAAFCGIARPQQFFVGLREIGVTIAACRAFPDHHRFSLGDLATLAQSARIAGAGAFVTTEKDRMRLGPLAQELALTAPLYTAGLQVVLEDEAAIAGWLNSLLRCL